MKKLFIASCALAALIAAALAAPVAAELATGGYYMTVQGESMAPTYRLGDVLLVTPVEPHDIRVGDIVVARFPGTTGHDSLYVHRVVGTQADSFQLRGDNNATDDPLVVAPEQIAGAPLVALTDGFGEAFTFSQNVFGRASLVGLALFLVSWPSILRGRGHAEEGSAHDREDASEGVHRRPAGGPPAAT